MATVNDLASVESKQALAHSDVPLFLAAMILVSSADSSAEADEKIMIAIQRDPCPNCGERGGRTVYWDLGEDAQTGYHDTGEGCTLCCPPPRSVQ